MTASTETGRSWLTTVLRPAGTMTDEGAVQFARALSAASASSQLVLVDLASSGPLPRSARRALETADGELSRTGGALLITDPGERQHLPEQLLRQVPLTAGRPAGTGLSG